jgi:hypothetical protein
MSNFPSSFMTALSTSGAQSARGAQTVTVRDATADSATTILTLSHSTPAAPSDGMGVRLVFSASSGAGDGVVAGAITVAHSTVTSGAEVGLMRLAPGTAGDLGEGLRIQGVASGVNGFLMTSAAASGVPVLSAYGSDTNITMGLAARGTGALRLQTPGGTTIFSVLSTGGLTVYSDTQTGASPTVSRPAGKVRVQSGGATLTVTNTLVTTSSLVLVTPQSAPTNAVYVKSVIPGAGSFVITLSDDPGASHLDLAFLVLN